MPYYLALLFMAGVLVSLFLLFLSHYISLKSFSGISFPFHTYITILLLHFVGIFRKKNFLSLILTIFFVPDIILYRICSFYQQFSFFDCYY